MIKCCECNRQFKTYGGLLTHIRVHNMNPVTYSQKYPNHTPRYMNKEFLYLEYVSKDKSIIQIAKENDTTDTVILRCLNYYDINTSRHNHIDLHNDFIHFIQGELLGDGSLSCSRKSARYHHGV